MINKLKSIYFYLLYKVNKLKSAKIVCLEMVRLLCSEIWVFAFVGWRYVPSPPVLSRVNNNVMLIICHTVQHKIDFYLWNFKSTIRRMCLFMFWCWACHKTESTDLPFEYEHVCHGVMYILLGYHGKNKKNFINGSIFHTKSWTFQHSLSLESWTTSI